MEFLYLIILGGIVGFFLGFFGSGGSVLALPILVYILKMPTKEAIVASLVIVGATAISGSIQKMRQHQICYKIAVIFGLSGMVGAFSGAKVSVYFLASHQLILFSVLMLISSGSMLFKRNKNNIPQADTCNMAPYMASILGFSVGGLTGLVGVGGGFLIVPALSALGDLSLRMSMGTSLFIISLNSISGIIGYMGLIDFNFKILGLFIVGSSIASVFGAKLSSKINPEKMKKAFSVFILLIGILLFIKNMKEIL